jgi:hypothetical protein
LIKIYLNKIKKIDISLLYKDENEINEIVKNKFKYNSSLNQLYINQFDLFNEKIKIINMNMTIYKKMLENENTNISKKYEDNVEEREALILELNNLKGNLKKNFKIQYVLLVETKIKKIENEMKNYQYKNFYINDRINELNFFFDLLFKNMDLITFEKNLFKNNLLLNFNITNYIKNIENRNNYEVNNENKSIEKKNQFLEINKNKEMEIEIKNKEMEIEKLNKKLILFFELNNYDDKISILLKNDLNDIKILFIEFLKSYNIDLFNLLIDIENILNLNYIDENDFLINFNKILYFNQNNNDENENKNENKKEEKEKIKKEIKELKKNQKIEEMKEKMKEMKEIIIQEINEKIKEYIKTEEYEKIENEIKKTKELINNELKELMRSVEEQKRIKREENRIIKLINEFLTKTPEDIYLGMKSNESKMEEGGSNTLKEIEIIKPFIFEIFENMILLNINIEENLIFKFLRIYLRYCEIEVNEYINFQNTKLKKILDINFKEPNLFYMKNIKILIYDFSKLIVNKGTNEMDSKNEMKFDEVLLKIENFIFYDNIFNEKIHVLFENTLKNDTLFNSKIQNNFEKIFISIFFNENNVNKNIENNINENNINENNINENNIKKFKKKFEIVINLINEISKKKTPSEKLDLITESFKLTLKILETEAVEGSIICTDDLLPNLICILTLCDNLLPFYEISFIKYFIFNDILLMEKGYYFSSFESAISFIFEFK